MRLLAMLGRPERHLPPVVHVAGTNGKGSVIAFLSSILEAAGYRVHAYTSPHLVRFNERIRIAGKIINDGDLESLLDQCVRVNQDNDITFFEMTTAAAFLAFSRVRADVLLVETGLGGRLDATNVILRPYLTVLTPISIDHENYLGEGIVKIATEKAGIMKSNCITVVGVQKKSALNVIARTAYSRGISLWRSGYEWRLHHRGFGTIFESPVNRRLLPTPSLIGVHQRDNAGLAVASLDQMPAFTVSDSEIRVGLTRACWPGRFHQLSDGPLTRLLPPRTQLWVDGGHNPAAGTALAATVRQRFHKGQTCLVVGMLKNKSLEGFLGPFSPLVKRVLGLSIAGENNCITAESISVRAKHMGFVAEAASDIGSAIKSASVESEYVLVCGSLHLAGQVLSANNEAPN